MPIENKIRVVNKKIGETPLDCVIKLKKDEPELGNLPVTYAGRLDPLASGVLLLLIDDECHKKDEYLKLSKEYEVEILFGFATDTYDVLGKIIKTKKANETLNFPGPRMREDEEPDHVKFNVSFASIINSFVGKIKQSYPAYSSRTVNGKPLFMWAREGKIDEIEIPSHDVFIESIDLIGEKQITGKKLLEKITKDISLIKGDFRQDEILTMWHDELKNKYNEKYPIIRLRVICGSGVYMRSLSYEIGQAMGIASLALDIVRTKIGEYTIKK
jgi:tRNA pseudouridine55 synthase